MNSIPPGYEALFASPEFKAARRVFACDDADEVTFDECYDEAKRRYQAERYPATAADILWRAKALFDGDEQ